MSKSVFLIPFLTCLLSFSNSLQAQKTSLIDKVDNWYQQGSYELIINDSANIVTYAESHADSISAELLYYLGDAFLAFDMLESAIPHIKKELEIRKNLKNPDPLLIADLTSNLGYYYSILNDYKVAEEYLQQAIAIYKATEGTEGESYIASSIMLNQLYKTTGNYLAAQKLLRNLENNTQEEINLLLINREQVDLLIQLGQYAKAERLGIQKIEEIKASKGMENLSYIEMLNTLAAVKIYQSEYADAELYYNECIELSQKVGLSQDIISSTKNNLAIIYAKIGLYHESNDLLKAIITDETNYENAISLRNIAINYAALNEYNLAKEFYLKSNKIVTDIFQENSLPYLISMKEYAINIAIHENIDSAIFLSEKSLRNAEKLFKKENPELSKYELQLGKIYYKNNELAKAQKHLDNAYKLRTRYLSINHPLFAESTKKLAELAWANQNEKEALNYFKDTFRNYFNQIEAYFPALSEQQKANFYGNILRPAFEEFNSYVLAYQNNNPELLSDMYNYQLATKGLIMYASAKARDNILKSNKPELIAQYHDWIATKELIAKAYSLTVEEIEDQNIHLDSLLNVSKSLEKSLSRQSAAFSSVFEQKSISWKDIQAKLKPNEAAIEVIRFKVFSPDSNGRFLSSINYAALLIDKKSQYPQLILLSNGNELEDKFIKNYRNAIKYKVRDKYSYTNYWEPIAKKTTAYDKIYFSPDGVYNQISINSLYNTNTKKYVLEEQNIQLLTNTKDLIAFRSELKNSSATANAAQLFGFPNYNKGLSNEGPSNQIDAAKIADNVSMDRGLRGSLSRYIRGNSLVTLLPGTKEEVEKISTLYNESGKANPVVHLSDAADEQQLKNVDNPVVLHIATHGFFLEDTPTNQDNTSDKYSENPLLKSGLIMAGANSFITSGIDESTGQDGILTAYEAMNMNLTNTDLVVLSACETGLGDLKNGEGVYGLRRAFFVAGADAIIMSLWSVDDAATQELMTSFYQEWLKGKSKEQAFKNAQIITKQKYKDPFYWAAFVMVGE